ncbi:pyridoxal-phosphate dependent enzyme [Litoreibacter arenae]|uniref:Pyridoxal-5'-phosphate-dependent enzyme, beta subunit n=1 Tax=Litoreibacter arenae DSM 19593 TaxID=1123360 RepID=S9S238_9RHOB|nr:pyridoxal-phosphate dependent enzyme [Litoreibacter arenae]EPX80274.1 Pyridoxal-5'-phosphate-dependent enzyme, beta subunit [Litoreibacter arenae DSM 19593]
MPDITSNPWRGRGLDLDAEFPCDNPQHVRKLLAQCPVHSPTPLLDMPALAEQVGVASVVVKDERTRKGLGSFKALGAAYAIAREAELTGLTDLKTALNGRTFVTASAGNHGLSVAAGAQIFGADAVIYLAETVPAAFADRLQAMGARVMRAGATYEDSMEAAEAAAAAKGWTLLSDSSWPGYSALPLRVMEGYLQLAAEAAEQMPKPPTHILLQAGVGGLAAAVAAYSRKIWGDAPEIIVVEPSAAPALQASIAAGKVVETQGPVSSMGRLDCKTPSLIALNGLARDADLFVTISEDEANHALPILAGLGLDTTPSGGAGLAALLAGLPLGPDARVWAILSEGPEGG